MIVGALTKRVQLISYFELGMSKLSEKWMLIKNMKDHKRPVFDLKLF